MYTNVVSCYYKNVHIASVIYNRFYSTLLGTCSISFYFSVQFDGQRAVSGAYDYLVRVWDPVDGRCLHVLQGHTNRVYSLQVGCVCGGTFICPMPYPYIFVSHDSYTDVIGMGYAITFGVHAMRVKVVVVCVCLCECVSVSTVAASSSVYTTT